MKTVTRQTYLLFAIVAYSMASCMVSAGDRPATILVWGDSLSAGYGVAVEKAWVSLMQKALDNRARVVNGSISGETTGGGLARFPEAMQTGKPDLVILELGANDGLRGLDLKQMQSNLTAMIETALSGGADVVLVGMKLPPNYGLSYSRRFEQIYSELADRYRLSLVPFMLEGIATDFSLMQADGVHPTAEAQKMILANILPVVQATLAGTVSGTQ